MESIVNETCITCGCVFGVPATFNAQRRKDGKAFYCPSGHSMVYTPGPSEAEKLREHVASMQRRIDALHSNLDHERGKYRCIVAGCDRWIDGALFDYETFKRAVSP